MRILIDGMNLALSQGTGVATYARNLSYCVKEGGHHLSVLYGRGVPAYRDPLLREAAFFDSREKGQGEVDYYLDLLRSFAGWRPSEIPETGKVMREQIQGQLPAADAFYNIRSLFFRAAARFQHFGLMLDVTPPEPVDIAHWTYPVPLRIRGAKNIYTFHDLVPLKLPYTTLDVKSRYYRMLKRIARSADHVVTVSDHSRADILSMLPIREDRVTNTYQSVHMPADLMAASDAQVEIDLDALDPGGDRRRRQVRRGEFFLYVGAIEPKKNLMRILEAYLSSGVRQPLVVVGRAAWSCKDELKLIKQSPGRIIYLDYIPFSQVVTLMRSARALIFASLYEGFGLPVLEGFVCGAPVITARASSTAEIAGDAAMLVDPYDIPDIRDAIRRLGDDGSADLRAEMRDKGLKRAEAFSQTAIAARLNELYDRVGA